jgi:hypothetical protein
MNFNRKDNKIKFPSMSLSSNTKSPLQKGNKEIIDEIIKEQIRTKSNKDIEIDNAETLGNNADLGTNKEEQIDDSTSKEVICYDCKEKLDEEWKTPHWKWNLDKNTKFCIKCYMMKETEYEKLMGCCIACNSKLKFIRYNPKPEWKLRGQLCRKCWDSQNEKHKSNRLH